MAYSGLSGLSICTFRQGCYSHSRRSARVGIAFTAQIAAELSNRVNNYGTIGISRNRRPSGRINAPTNNVGKRNMVKINTGKVLNRDEQNQLIATINGGDDGTADRAETMLIESMFPLVLRIVNPILINEPASNHPDIIMAAIQGMRNVIRTFDQTRGYVFITYAKANIKECAKTASKLQREIITTPRRKCNRQDYISMSNAARNLVSFGSWHSQPHEGQSPTDHEDQKIRLRFLSQAFAQISNSDQQIITMRYGLSGNPTMAFQKIAKELGISTEWSRKTLAKALQALRNKYNEVKK